jgi:hypothetical protein
MLNVKTLTDTMSRMELPQLQQYAALHKNDPYIVTLALSIANQKKQMKMGQDGQAGMMPQPKVVDQQISEMAPPPQQMAQAMPEDQGIATLPAQNMQNFAGGGIVAFEEGGDVPGYAGGVFTGDPLAEYLKQIGMSPQEFISKNGNEQQQIRAAATANKPLVPPPAVPVAQAAAAAKTAAAKPTGGLSKLLGPLAVATDLFYPSNEAEKKASLPYKLGAQAAVDERNTKLAAANEYPEDYAARKVAEMEAAAGKKLSPDIRNTAMSKFVKEKMAENVSKGSSFITDSKYVPTTTPADITAVVEQDGTQPAPVPAAKPTAEDAYEAGVNKLIKSSQTASSMGPISQLDAKRYSFTPAEMANIKPEDFANALESAMPKNPTASPFDAQQQELNKANVATRQNAKTELEKQFKEQGLAFESTLNKLTSKEKRVQTMEDNQLGMAMLEAGLNMMAGESPYAMVNIGKGAQVGTKKYMEIQDKVEGARDKIDEMKMKIEEFRRNEANMNARELRAAQRDIDDSVSAGAQSMINLAREQYGLNRNQAISFVSNSMQIQQFNVGEKNRAAAQNQQTAANIDTAYAQMANQRSIAADARNTQLGIAALEAKYKKDNPAAGSLGFYKQLGGGDPIKGLDIFSKSMGVEAKGSDAILLDWQKKSPIEKQMARKADPIGSAQLDRMLQERVLQGSMTDKPAGSVLDQQ